MERILVYGMSNNLGGIETYIMNYYRKLHAKRLIQFDFAIEGEHCVFQDEIYSLGGRIFCLPERHGHAAAHMTAFRKLLKNHPEYHTVYYCIAISSAAILPLVASAGLARRAVVHSHNSHIRFMNRHRIFKPFLNLMLDERLACSTDSARFMFGSRSDVKIIPNAIATDRYQFDVLTRDHMRGELHCNKKMVFGCVGMLNYQKNPLRTIELYESLLAYIPDSCLYMIGIGELQEEVEKYIKEHDLQTHVMLKGRVYNVQEWMQVFDIFILMSRFEGFPMVGVEAQCAGLPCIFSDHITREIAFSEQVYFAGNETNIADLAKWCQKAVSKPRNVDIPAQYNIDISCRVLADVLSTV